MDWITTAFPIALPLAAAPILVLGDRHARAVAAVQVAAFALTLAVRATEYWRFAHLSLGVTLIDLSVLAVVAHAAIRSRRWWIVLSASLLVFPPLGHFAKLVNPRLWPSGYWLMTNLPALPCLLLLFAGAAEALRRRRNAAGTSHSCSEAVPRRRSRRRDW